MKICAYEVREDEKKDFARMAEKLQVEIELHDEIPGPDTAALAEGCEGVTMLGMGKIDRAGKYEVKFGKRNCTIA